MALGADRSTVMRNVITDRASKPDRPRDRPAAGDAGRARTGSQLYGLGAQDPTTGDHDGILMMTSVLAAAVPARRASTIDPARAARRPAAGAADIGVTGERKLCRCDELLAANPVVISAVGNPAALILMAHWRHLASVQATLVTRSLPSPPVVAVTPSRVVETTAPGTGGP